MRLNELHCDGQAEPGAKISSMTETAVAATAPAKMAGQETPDADDKGAGIAGSIKSPVR